MVWNYHDDDLQGDAENVQLSLKGIPSPNVKLQEYRIDKGHSNSYEVWKAMGSPQHPTQEQITQLERAGQLERTANRSEKIKNGLYEVNVSVPRQGIVFYDIRW